MTKLAVVAFAGAMAAGAAVEAQEMKFFRIGTGGAGGTYFPVVDENHTLAHRDAVGWEPSTASETNIGSNAVEVM